jgi:hypothetical protein
MLSLLIIFIILGAFASMAAQYSNISRFASVKDRTLQAAQLALERIRTEATEAFNVTTPGGVQITLQRVDPEDTTRLPTPPGSPPSWNPYQQTITIQYYVSAQTMVRSANGQAENVAYGVQGMSCAIDSTNNLQVRMSVMESVILTTLSTEVFLPLRW